MCATGLEIVGGYYNIFGFILRTLFLYLNIVIYIITRSLLSGLHKSAKQFRRDSRFSEQTIDLVEILFILAFKEVFYANRNIEAI